MVDAVAHRVVWVLALVSTACVFGFVTTSGAQPYDHLACYKIKDTKTFRTAQASLSPLPPQFLALGCEIKGKARDLLARAGERAAVDLPVPLHLPRSDGNAFVHHGGVIGGPNREHEHQQRQ